MSGWAFVFLVYLTGCAVMSVVTAAFLWWDKRAARRETWRVSENTLHGLELLGGWPGSFVTRRLIRHKTRKRQYRIVFTLIVLVHVLAVAAWVVRGR